METAMSVNMINSNLPKLKIPNLFDSSPNSQRRTPNPLKFTTESSLEETNKINAQKSNAEKKSKPLRTSENWYG